MKWIAFALRMVLGLGFFVFGLEYFLKFMKFEMPPLPQPAMDMMSAMGPTGYLKVVKILEIVGGFLILTGRFAPLGLVIITPIAVNILLWDLLIMNQPALGVVFTAICVLLILYYWRHFVGVFKPAPVV